MKIGTQNNEYWDGEYKKYRSTDEQIRQNRYENQIQRQRDESARSGNSDSQNSHTADEQVVPAANCPS